MGKNKARFFVRPCDDETHGRTWDLVERLPDGATRTCVQLIKSRRLARGAARARNTVQA